MSFYGTFEHQANLSSHMQHPELTFLYDVSKSAQYRETKKHIVTGDQTPNLILLLIQIKQWFRKIT